jgi:hypothetical protein
MCERLPVYLLLERPWDGPGYCAIAIGQQSVYSHLAGCNP